jgi:hypothetical protein
MSRLSPPAVVSDIDARDVSTVKVMRWGSVRESWDGKRFRYGSAGASNLAHAKMNVAPVAVAAHTNQTVAAAAAIGARKVSLNLGATAIVVGDYADGQLNTNDATGEGYSYDVTDTTASAGSVPVTVKLDEGLKEALVAATSEATLVANPWYKAIVAPGAIAHRPIGVNCSDIPAASTGFFQTRGDCPVLSDGIVTKGAGAILSDAVNGALEIEVAATVVKRVATALAATVDTEYPLFNLCVE